MIKRRVEVMVVRTVTSLLCRMMLDSSNAMWSTVKVRVRASAKYKITSLHLASLEGKIGSLHYCSRILEDQNILKQ